MVTWPRVANDETDFLKVGFLFLGRVMLMEVKVVRLWSRGR